MSIRNDLRALLLVNGAAVSALAACDGSPTLPEARLLAEADRLVGSPIQVGDDVWLPLGASSDDSGGGALLRIRPDGSVDSYGVDYTPSLLRAVDGQLLVLTSPPPDAFNGSILIQPLP